MKKTLSILLAVALIVALAVPALASTTPATWKIDVTLKDFGAPPNKHLYIDEVTLTLKDGKWFYTHTDNSVWFAYSNASDYTGKNVQMERYVEENGEGNTTYRYEYVWKLVGVEGELGGWGTSGNSEQNQPKNGSNNGNAKNKVPTSTIIDEYGNNGNDANNNGGGNMTRVFVTAVWQKYVITVTYNISTLEVIERSPAVLVTPEEYDRTDFGFVDVKNNFKGTEGNYDIIIQGNKLQTLVFNGTAADRPAFPPIVID